MPQARAGDLRLSGNSYVPMRLRENPEEHAAPTPIASELRCEHLTTVCTICLPEWETDWIVLYSRTNGGRNLAARAGIHLDPRSTR